MRAYCLSCKHFDAHPVKDATTEPTGYCHRFPPVRNPNPGIGGRLNVYPIVGAGIDYCGEYSPKK